MTKQRPDPGRRQCGSRCASQRAHASTHTASILSAAAPRSKLLASSTSAAQAPWARSPAAVVAAAAAADGAGWGAEASRWHPERRDAAAATPTPARRAPRGARELHSQAARPGPGRPAGRETPTPAPRRAMFKKLKQKISEEQQQLQQASAPAQVRRSPAPGPGGGRKFSRDLRPPRKPEPGMGFGPPWCSTNPSPGYSRTPSRCPPAGPTVTSGLGVSP